MIRILRKRFIRIAVLVLMAAMVLVVGIVNMANLIIVRSELSGTVKELADNYAPAWKKTEGPERSGMPESAGEFPGEFPGEGSEWAPENGSDTGRGRGTAAGSGPGRGNSDNQDISMDFGWMMERSRHFRNLVSESAWFIVYITPEGDTWVRNLGDIPDLDEEGAKKLALQAAESGNGSGWVQDYCYAVQEQGDVGRAVVLMNCETRMAAVRNVALISAIACAAGILISWLLVRLFSRKAVEPTIRNMEQQKQFITNASHELKTPLTVISTNMELLKMETPDNQWIRSTQKQTAAMRHLVDELVYLSRMEEEYPALTMEPLNLSAMLQETAEPFQAMAEFNGKEMTVIAEDGLRVTGDRASVQRLMSTLCDNAVKYTPEGGSIVAEAVPDGKYAVVRVSNNVEKPMTKEQCAQLFNRFYRADESRNKEKQSGFGIGLAIAAAIAEKHGGSMKAEMDGEMLVISAFLPREHKQEGSGGKA